MKSFLTTLAIAATLLQPSVLLSPLQAAGSASLFQDSQTAQKSRVTQEDAARDLIRMIENSGRKSLEALIDEFEQSRFAPSYLTSAKPADRRDILERIQDAARDAGGVSVSKENDDTIVTLEGESTHKVSFRLESAPPFRITFLAVEPVESRQSLVSLTPDNIAEKLTELADQGLSGVVYVKLDGKELLRAAYGLANAESNAPMKVDTIFGVGSRPIDFTVAGILLLDQNKKLSLDDAITKYIEGVPADKSGMTIRHLLDDRSGLPDFHGLPSDWDQDLAWIDRDEAERRILSQPLFFAPGAEESHSHSGFGLLAAIIEHVSGEDYLAFLERNFFTPAEMTRTGEYGDHGDFQMTDFAEGNGPSFIGLPNIPPNWGKTSWLVRGSGGMYSTLDDLLNFYDYIRTSGVLDSAHRGFFLENRFNLDGSERGFDLFSGSDEGASDEVYLFVNMKSGDPLFQDVYKALENFVVSN